MSRVRRDYPTPLRRICEVQKTNPTQRFSRGKGPRNHRKEPENAGSRGSGENKSIKDKSETTAILTKMVSGNERRTPPLRSASFRRRSWKKPDQPQSRLRKSSKEGGGMRQKGVKAVQGLNYETKRSQNLCRSRLREKEMTAWGLASDSQPLAAAVRDEFARVSPERDLRGGASISADEAVREKVSPVRHWSRNI